MSSGTRRLTVTRRHNPTEATHYKYKTRWYPPGLRRNARRENRPPRSRIPDDFLPCSRLKHGSYTADCSLPHTRRTGVSVTERKRWWTTGATPDSIWGILMEITCEWEKHAQDLIDNSEKERETLPEERAYITGAYQQRGRPLPSPELTPHFTLHQILHLLKYKPVVWNIKYMITKWNHS